MKNLLVVFMLLVSAVVVSHADESNLTLTIDGNTYSNVTFGAVTATFVTIRHSSGIDRVPLKSLPPEFQERLEGDRKGAEAKAAIIASRQAQTRLQNMRRINGIVYDLSTMFNAQVQEERVRTSETNFPYNIKHSDEWLKNMKVAQENNMLYDKYRLYGTVIQVLDNGLLVNRLTVRRQVPGMQYESLGLVFVKNYPNEKTVFDGSEVSYPFVMMTGRHKYIDTTGAEKTIPLLDCGEQVKNGDPVSEAVLIGTKPK